MTDFHSYRLYIYQEDVDDGGHVYHANYLKYTERARTEWLRDHGLTQSLLAAREGLYFVVTDLTIRYVKPAVLDDELEIRSEAPTLQGIRLVFPQKIYRGSVLCVDMMVFLALINEDGKPVRPPYSIRKLL